MCLSVGNNIFSSKYHVTCKTPFIDHIEMKKLCACWKNCCFEDATLKTCHLTKNSSFCSFLWHFNINFPNFFNVLGNNWNLLCSFHFIFYHKIFLREHLSAWIGVFYSPFELALTVKKLQIISMEFIFTRNVLPFIF